MTNLQVGADLTSVAQLHELHVGSVVQSTCPEPSHYTKQANEKWRDQNGYEWDAEDFTVSGGFNQIEAVVIHVGDNPADHSLDVKLPGGVPAAV